MNSKVTIKRNGIISYIKLKSFNNLFIEIFLVFSFFRLKFSVINN